MKRLIIIAFAASAMLAACTSRTAELKYDLQQWKDSTEHAHLSVETEFPVGKKGIAPVIRQQLTAVLDEQLSHIASYEGERLFPPYAGDAPGFMSQTPPTPFEFVKFLKIYRAAIAFDRKI